MINKVISQENTIVVGKNFLTALAAQDFDQLEGLFHPQVRFRALLPPRTVTGETAIETTDWLRRWFGDADELQVIQSTTEQVFDRLHLSYRLRVHDVLNGWRAIEQQAYSIVQDGHIVDMWLLCSGFRTDSENGERGTGYEDQIMILNAFLL